MGLAHSPRIVTDGLVFAMDGSNRAKSFIGAPSTNYAHFQNPRLDATYSSYVNTQSGTWAAKHSDAITVYNLSGGGISNYVNTGVTDYTNAYHAIWTLDPILRKPVVTMRDFDGTWKAKHFITDLHGTSLQSLGLTTGDKYTISWLQWTDTPGKYVDCGVYCHNSSSTLNFHDGLSGGSSTSLNTEVGKWERVYHTYTISANRDVSKTYDRIYMYGMYGGEGTIKIADLQYELLPYPTGFDYNQTRSNTQAFLDLAGNHTITSSAGLSYAADGSFSFPSDNGGYLDSPVTRSASYVTISAWVKVETHASFNRFVNNNWVGSGWLLYSNGTNWIFGVGQSGSQTNAVGAHSSSTAWTNLVGVYDGSNVRLYVNGVQVSSPSLASATLTTSGNIRIGADAQGTNYINNVKMYNRALSAEEVKQNFNALRGRYGI